MTRSASKSVAKTKFDGWRVGLVLICVAVFSSLLSIPRPVAPSTLPRPNVDWSQVRKTLRQQEALATEARQGLSYPVRVVGELVRRVGRAEREASEELVALRRQLKRATQNAASKALGRELLMLRALQTQLFAQAVRRWRPSSDPDLIELGGNFSAKAEMNQWLGQTGPLLSEPELRAMFRVRWTQLTGLESAKAFRLRPQDWQLMLGFYISRPPSADPRERDQLRLGFIDELGRRDKDYPVAFARGIVLYRSGAYSAALEQFRLHLKNRPSGPWGIRARNFAAGAARAMMN